MTQPRRILWFVVFAAAALLLPSRAAQNSITPTVKPTPPGQLIVVNNSPGANHTDPHVDTDLVSYTNQPSGGLSSNRYHVLAAGTDNAVPPASRVLAPRKIRWFAVFVAAVLLLPMRAAEQSAPRLGCYCAGGVR